MAAQVHTHDIHVLFFLYLFIISQLLVLSNSSSVNGGPNGFSLEIVHRDSIESPLYPGNLTIEERVERLVQQSKARASYLTLRKLISANITSGAIHPDGPRMSIFHYGSYYIAKVGFGTFNNERTSYKAYGLIVDTGSDLTWTQCEGCRHCFHQNEPLFPYRRSSSYEPLPCDRHHLCDLGLCDGPACAYSYSYGDGSKTSGILAHETLTVNSEIDGRTAQVGSFVFGCGLEQQNFDEENEVSGILGLSAGDKSFVKQVGRNRFSYCFPPYNHGTTASTLLRFGDDATIGSNTGERIYTTPIKIGRRVPLYYLNLIDVSVAETRLRFPRNSFTLRDNGSGGCLLDTGAPLTHFARPQYERIKRFVIDYYHNIGLEPLTGWNHVHGYDLCYRKPWRDFNNFLVITYHFEGGADFDAELGFVDAGSNFCLGIVPSDRAGAGVIIGAHQTANHRLLYDLNRMQLSFVKERC